MVFKYKGLKRGSRFVNYGARAIGGAYGYATGLGWKVGAKRGWKLARNTHRFTQAIWGGPKKGKYYSPGSNRGIRLGVNRAITKRGTGSNKGPRLGKNRGVGVYKKGYIGQAVGSMFKRVSHKRSYK